MNAFIYENKNKNKIYNILMIYTIKYKQKKFFFFIKYNSFFFIKYNSSWIFVNEKHFFFFFFFKYFWVMCKIQIANTVECNNNRNRDILKTISKQLSQNNILIIMAKIFFIK